MNTYTAKRLESLLDSYLVSQEQSVVSRMHATGIPSSQRIGREMISEFLSEPFRMDDWSRRLAKMTRVVFADFLHQEHNDQSIEKSISVSKDFSYAFNRKIADEIENVMQTTSNGEHAIKSVRDRFKSIRSQVRSEYPFWMMIIQQNVGGSAAAEKSERPSLDQRNPSVMTDDEPYDPPPWPESLSQLQVVKNIDPEIGLRLMIDPKTRGRYYLKYGQSDTQLEEEMAAEAMYAAFEALDSTFEVGIPDYKEYEENGRMVKLSRRIPGKPLNEMSVSDEDYGRVMDDIKNAFVLDAFLGNSDVLGEKGENVTFSVEKYTYRTNNSKALRAAGSVTKGDRAVTELWSMRDGDSYSAKIFKSIPSEEILAQIIHVGSVLEENPLAMGSMIDETVKSRTRAHSMKKYIEDRSNSLIRMKNNAAEMISDGMDAGYVLDKFGKHYMKMKEKNLEKYIPKSLHATESEDSLGFLYKISQKNVSTDDFFLFMNTYHEYCIENNVNPEEIYRWIDSAIKIDANENYAPISTEAFAIQHAVTTLILETTQIPWHQENFVKLWGRNAAAGPSVWSASPIGKNVRAENIPLHRIVAMFPQRQPNGKSIFAGDERLYLVLPVR